MCCRWSNVSTGSGAPAATPVDEMAGRQKAAARRQKTADARQRAAAALQRAAVGQRAARPRTRRPRAPTRPAAAHRAAHLIASSSYS